MPDRRAVMVAMAKSLARYRFALALVSTVLLLLALLPEGGPADRRPAGQSAKGPSGGGFTTIDPTPSRGDARPGSGAQVAAGGGGASTDAGGTAGTTAT
ncbi:MAG: hypothetical protein ACRD0C_05400, partial [Acidimicrobiia bacterium]